MKRNINIYKYHFTDFYTEQELKVKLKINFILDLIKMVRYVPSKFLAPIQGEKGLYEIRIEYESNIFRIFCCFSKDNTIVLFNGFQKKTEKTPLREIKKARRLKAQFFNEIK